MPVPEAEQQKHIDLRLAPAVKFLEGSKAIAAKIDAVQFSAYPGWDQASYTLEREMPLLAEAAAAQGLFAFWSLIQVNGQPVLLSVVSKVAELPPEAWMDIFRKNAFSPEA